TAFRLYDTYGFPFELTLEIAEEQGYSVDKAGFEHEMEEQRNRARASRAELESMSSQSIDLMNFDAQSAFKGYEATQTKAKVIGLFQNGKRVSALAGHGEVILDTTVFYAESGGQVADTGLMQANDLEVVVTDVKKAPNKQHLHSVEVLTGELVEGMEVELLVNGERRNIITSNHSATHLLQSALKHVVGDHITQAGSFVSEEYLRFDFTHFEKVSASQLKEVEALVNQAIWAQANVEVAYQSIEEAKASGAMALFGEKYGDVVRVVTMGEFSKELCGGTHVSNTAQIGIFKIVGEESVGSGVRRVTGITNKLVYQTMIQLEQEVETIATDVKATNRSLLTSKVRAVVEENTALKKQLATLNGQLLQSKANDLIANAQEINDLKVVLATFENIENNDLKMLADDIRSKVDRAVVFLISKWEDRLIFVAGANQSAVQNGVHCGNLVKMAASLSDGKGGGRPDLAQAGGKDVTKVDAVIENVKNTLNSL
ncbi:MAG: alanine--tRNA ligase-related protein, partial [Erysipelotrichaceae bacterium]